MITVYKIGGNVVDNPAALGRFLDDFASIEGPKVLVHGGGKEATRLSAALGIETTMIDGRRVTDAATIDVVTMVYAGLINKRVVAALQARGVNAIGLSGADAGVVRATRRPARPVDYGFVGDLAPEGVDTGFIGHLLARGIVPVFCAIMHDGAGQLLNCNADSVASAVAKALAQCGDVRLVYCFEKDGVLTDIDRPDSVIPRIDRAHYATLRENGVVNKGMIPKIDNAFEAIDAGVKEVVIKNSEKVACEGAGTTIA